MKKIFLLLALAGVCQVATAQKFGYIDTDFILGKMPEAQKAQSELEASSGRIREAIGPYTRFVRAQREQLGGLSEELHAVDGVLGRLRADIDRG